VLTGGSRTALPRLQTLRAAVDWSYDLLTEPARALLRDLSVFAGGFVLEAAEVICSQPATDGDLPSTVRGPPSDDVLGLLLSLVDGSLVEAETEDGGESRYRLLEPIRQYALEQLRAVGEEATLRRRHLAWCLDLVERGASARFGADAAVWAPRLIVEQDNVRAALAWSLADVTPGSTSAGLRLAREFHHFWYFHDHLTEGRQWLERVLAADQAHNGEVGEPLDTVDTAADLRPAVPAAIRLGALGAHPRVAALNALSHLACQQQDHTQATARLEETLALARSVQDTHGVAHALVTLGQLALAQGEYDRSVALLEESRPLFTALDNSFGLWRALNTLGEVCNLQGEHERAGRLHEEGLVLARSMGYFWSIAQGLRQLGLVAYRQGDLERAERLLGESIVWWRDARATRGLQWSHAELGHVVLARGNRETAAAHFADSLMLCRQAGDRHGIAVGLEGVAAVAAWEATSPDSDETGARLQRAARLLNAAGALREAVGVPVSPIERPTVEGAEAAARSGLGEAAFAAVRVEGRAMPIEVAVDDALDLARSSGAVATGLTPAATPPRSPRSSPLSQGEGARLTAREREIAALVARGFTNRRIAQRLIISERTVHGHVSNILARLGFNARAQIAAWAVQQELVAPDGG
jgi:DNA-binding CsgD family transcriptional regulator/Tfp pilus assembly protein PilF